MENSIAIAARDDLLKSAGLSLVVIDGKLTLTDGELSICGDFTHMVPRMRADRIHQELLVRAAKCKGVESPIAIDATAGLGEDSLLLASAGFTVQLYEQNPVIAALLEDALHRALNDERLAPAASRMTLHADDSIAAMETLNFEPDVVVLDPMFPARTKSAAVKKKFQLLHHLERPCETELALFEAARSAHPRKIVVKRPPKGPHLAALKPSYSLSGKSVRYDIYSLPR